MSGAVNCGRPGCDGVIEDGYCDTCGLAQKPAASGTAARGGGAHAAAGKAGSAGAVANAGAGAGVSSAAPAGPQRCTRSGCTGTIQDGYCDTCGMAAQPAAARAGSAAAAAGNQRGGSTSSASVRTSSTGRTSTGRTRGSARSARTTSSRTVTSTRGSRSTGRGGLGLGLVEIPEVEYRDPSEAILANPQVPEHKRYCSKCGEPVGRSRDKRPGRTSGFCAKCGSSYDFTPKLSAGEVIGGQYEVLGCIAHGGLGWIYLARDNNVSGAWRALKGLLDTGDEDAMAAAVAERQFLAEVDHPNVVKIYNFVQHSSGDYIVMEYVGGKSLKQIALDYKEANGGAPLPLAQVLAYAIEILPAFGYLHSIGLLYCDFKPDNIIQSEEQLKLIDMGAVRAFDDEVSAVYGTVGYQAPEIAEVGPTIESDLFTVGRMLAVLSFDFKGYTSTYATALPARKDVPLLAKYESFDRALRRATHPDRERRFSSAAEMAAQLTGVLREVLALDTGRPRPAISTLFTGERSAVGTDLSTPTGAQFAAGLPIPSVDPTDPNAGALATLGGPPAQVISALNRLPKPSTEVYYRLVRAAIEGGQFKDAGDWLDMLHREDAFDWRVDWYRGLLALAQQDATGARRCFEACYNELPGESAPKLAIAAAAELAGQSTEAQHYHRLVWAVDRSYVTSAFALARLLVAQGDHTGAVDVLGQVPESSIHHTAAEIEAIRIRIESPGFAGAVTPTELSDLGTRVSALGLDGEAHESLVCTVLLGALEWASAHPALGGDHHRVFDSALGEREVRRALERSYRARARMAADRATRIDLVDRANSVRPRTLI
jgi:serine/threonine-protein kinase PknG